MHARTQTQADTHREDGDERHDPGRLVGGERNTRLPNSDNDAIYVTCLFRFPFK